MILGTKLQSFWFPASFGTIILFERDESNLLHHPKFYCAFAVHVWKLGPIYPVRHSKGNDVAAGLQGSECTLTRENVRLYYKTISKALYILSCREQTFLPFSMLNARAEFHNKQNYNIPQEYLRFHISGIVQKVRHCS